jgi:hypothetical protein
MVRGILLYALSSLKHLLCNITAHASCQKSFSSKQSNPMAHATQYNAIELCAMQGGYTGINRVKPSGEIPTIEALQALNFKVIDWDGW